ncbi:hypothetical protein C0J52_19598 [Blattella germanica]|nr:hypothetical protein C0J52_19598 [Blattella germanica]
MCWRRSVVVLLVLLLSACRARISGSDGATSVTILKCCPNGQVLGINNFCKPAPSVLGHSWLPPIYNPLIGRLLEEPPKYWRIVEGTKPKCSRNCVATTTWSHISSPVFILLNNGSLLYEFKKYFNPESFCVDSLVAVICMEDSQCQDYEAAQQVPSEITVKKSRVKKCCGEGAVFSESKGHCIALPDSNDVAPNNLTLANFSSLPIDRKTVNFSLGFPVCLEGGQDLAVAGKLEEGESLKEDGSLYVPGVQITLKAEEFCIEHLLERPTDRASIFTCAEYLPSKSTPTIVREAEWDIRYTLYPIGLFLSAFFLAATLAAGCLLPSSHHMLHWRCQTGHVACLLVGDVLLAVTQLAGEKVSGAACTTLGKQLSSFHVLRIGTFLLSTPLRFSLNSEVNDPHSGS